MFSRSPAQPPPAAGARDPLPGFVQQAESLREAGELDRAEELLVRGLRDHGGDPRARAALAGVLADRGDTERAEGVWRDVLGLDPDYVPALRALADISEAAGRRDEAMDFFRRLIRVENAGFDFGHAEQEPQPADSAPAAAQPAADVAAEPAVDPDADPADVLRAASRAWEAERAVAGDEPSAGPLPSFTPDEREVEQTSAPLSFTPDDVDARRSHSPPAFTADEPDAGPPGAPLSFTADERDVAPSVHVPSSTADEPDAEQAPFTRGADPGSGTDAAPLPIAFHADAALQGAAGGSADFAETEFDEWDDDEALAGFDIVFMDEGEATEAAEAAVEEPAAAGPLASEASDEAAAEEAPDAAAVIEAVASAEDIDESAWSDESFAPAESSAVETDAAIEAVDEIGEAAWSDESFAPAEAGEDGFGPGFELPAIPAAEPAALEEVAEGDEAAGADAEAGAFVEADDAVSAAEDVAATADALEAAEAPAGPEPVAEWLRAIDDSDPTAAAAPFETAAGEDHRVDEVDLADAVDFGDEVDPAAAVDFADLAEPIGADVEPVVASATADASDEDQPGEPAAGYVFDDGSAGDPEALDAVEASYAAPAADEDAELDSTADVGTATDAPAVDEGGWPTTARLPHGVTLDPEPSPLAAAPEPAAPIATPQARPAAAGPAAPLATPRARPGEAPSFPPALPPDPALARAWFDRAMQRPRQEPKATPAPSVALVAAPREPWAPAPTLTGRASPVQLAQALVRVLERDGEVLGAASSVRRLLAVSIGRELGMEGTRLDGLALAAVLADLGGLFLRGGGQAGRGTDVSLTLLQSVPLTPEVHEALAMQHRRWDGGDGGPREDGIPFPARVLAVARDAAALLTGPARRGTDAAVNELQRGAGTTYDPMVVSVLRRVLARRERYGIAHGVGGRVMVAHPRELRSMDLAGRLHASGFQAETAAAGTLRGRLHGDLPLALIVGAELAAAEADTLRELHAIPAAAWMPVVVVDADDAELRPSLLAAGADLCFASSATFTEVGAALDALLRRLSTLAGGTAE